ncbi:MAG: FlgD immunoglobulin-like domain containing protein, partial [candidate division KSB1 bacterium]
GGAAPRAQLPERFTLAQNYPNPFNPSTNIAFALPARAEVSLKIYNVSGQLVRTLMNETRAAGQHVVQWDGKNSAGQEAASGVYWYRLQSGKQALQKQMTLMR